MRIGLYALTFAALLFTACKGSSQTAGEFGSRTLLKKQASEYKVPIEVIPATRGPIQEKIVIYGKLAPKQETLLSSQFTGRILHLTLSEGDRVKRGQVIARIQSPKAEALLQFSDKSPPETQNFGEELLPISIQAPFDGIVTKKFYFSGDVVSAGQPILKIQDDSVFYLWGQLPAVYLPDVRIGMEIGVSFPDLPGASFHRKIETINSTVDNQTQMAQIRTSLHNPEYLLKSDLFAKIEIIVKSVKNAILVPRNSVLTRNSVSSVFVEKDGMAHLKPVQIGIRTSGIFEITSGLISGDRVIVLGNYELQDGMTVEVMP